MSRQPSQVKSNGGPAAAGGCTPPPGGGAGPGGGATGGGWKAAASCLLKVKGTCLDMKYMDGGVGSETGGYTPLSCQGRAGTGGGGALEEDLKFGAAGG